MEYMTRKGGGRPIEGKLNSQADEIKLIGERTENIGDQLRSYLRVEKSKLPLGKQINHVTNLVQGIL